ncbi:MAG TPA: SDR family oxidoreductase [Candidatus Limnocylindrales bacterium]|nr:SDR family oxidoreductase [Candidatus Limnocylindrales bacterium]
MESLQDRVVVITGASAGIGRATAHELLGAGARVVLGARRRERLEAIESQFPGRVAGVEMDVRKPADCQRLVDAALQRFGRLDSLVANAGIGLYGGILDHTDEALKTMLDTNIAGTVWPIRAAVPEMIKNGHGDVVIVASVAGFRGGADEAVYAATKFAQVGLAGALDRELREKGIRVTTIGPAGTATEFAIGAGRTEDMPELRTYLRPEDVAFAIRTVLEQPRRLRTQYWTIWSMAQGS